MRQNLIIILTCFVLFVACGERGIEKPKGLIPQKKMVSILVDMHIADAIFQNRGNDKILERLKSEDIYYSVLKKHNIADSVFEKSVIYYANFPKDFEKIYAEVLDRVTQMQEVVNPTEKKAVDVGNK